MKERYRWKERGRPEGKKREGNLGRSDLWNEGHKRSRKGEEIWK